MVILLLYVDDLFLTGDEKLIKECNINLASEFEMKYLGIIHYFLGLEVWKKTDDIFMCQGKYAIEILKRLEIMDCKSMPTPMVTNLKLLSDTSLEIVDVTLYRQMIGLLMYLMDTMLDILFVVKNLSQYMVEPRGVHLIVEKHVLRYLKGMIDFGLQYVLDCKIILQDCVHSDWASSVTYRKST
jgi:hypothetical protein